jgi:hypothetical protein
MNIDYTLIGRFPNIASTIKEEPRALELAVEAIHDELTYTELHGMVDLFIFEYAAHYYGIDTNSLCTYEVLELIKAAEQELAVR